MAELSERSVKYEKLKEILRSYGSVGVAYSGGIDSTLLAYTAVSVCGSDNVVLVNATSCLLPEAVVLGAVQTVNELFGDNVRLHREFVNPLGDEQFVRNDRLRCYVCKASVYRKFLAWIAEESIGVLCDGTNCDDLLKDRPGLQAIRELGVKTPLVEAGLTKADIRAIASRLGLPNATLPSYSCLATRLATDTVITREKLEEVEHLETFMLSRNFQGCRVKPRLDTIILEVRAADFPRLANESERAEIITFFRKHGFETVLVNLLGRE